MQEGADLFQGVTKVTALASDGISREANLDFDIRMNFLSRLSQDSIGCLRRGYGTQMGDWN